MATSTHAVVDKPNTTRRLGERGANLVEYALLMALIAIVCVAGVSALGEKTKPGFSSVASAI